MIEDYKANVRKAVIPTFNIAGLTDLERNVLIASCEALKADLDSRHVFYREAFQNYATRYWMTGHKDKRSGHISFDDVFYSHVVREVVYKFGKKLSLLNGLDNMYFYERWNEAYNKNRREFQEIGIENEQAR